MTQVIQNVSDTAFMVAGFRAAENERPNPLFRDPLAARLAGEHGGEILATMPYSVVGAWSVVIRTVIIDELITRAIGEGVDTVLNLGAGLDTRPYRMALPEDLRWVEVDYPHVIGFKESRLTEEAPRCRLKRIELDLTDRQALRRFLADMSARATQGAGAHRGRRTRPDRDRRHRSCGRSEARGKDSLLDHRLLLAPGDSLRR